MNTIIAIKHIVALSSGTSSAVAADRVISRYGKDSVDLVFADTLIEDDDNYRFLLDLQRFWDKRIVHLVEGRTPYQVAEDEHIISNQKIHPCTYRLKIKPQIDYVRRVQSQGFRVVMHIGMNLQDAKPRKRKPFGRLVAPALNWGKLGVPVEYPLLWDSPVLDSNGYCREVMGIKPPRMYELGYTHANCGGMCVAQGMRDWNRTLTNWPDRYQRVEKWEARQRLDPVLAPYAILRDQSGGMVRPKTLATFRSEKEAAGASQQMELFDLRVDIDDTTCGVECGVGNTWQEVA